MPTQHNATPHGGLNRYQISAKRPAVRYRFLVENERKFLPGILGKIKVTALDGGGH